MRSGFRFDPPAVELTVAQAWVLARALGPADVRVPGSLDGRQAVETASLLGVAARIGARVGSAALADELGEEPAGRLTNAHRAAAARSVARLELCRRLGEIATGCGAPLILLKGAALEASGLVDPGSRESDDVDVLTASSSSERLQRACLAAGFSERSVRSAGHQLPPLRHPSGLVVEVHRFIRGVRVSGDRSATGEQLVELGLCRRGEGNLERVWLPEPDLLAAHALVHGVAQHGAAPASYPPLKVVADVADLGFGEHEWRGFLDRGLDWIVRDVSRDEAEAVWHLGRRLDRGDDPRQIAAGNDGAARMLRHVVAAAVDEGYRRSLRILHLSQPVAEMGRSRALLRKIATNVWLRREEVDAIYGTQPDALRYLAMRLWRPWDLALQGVSSVVERMKNRSSS